MWTYGFLISALKIHLHSKPLIVNCSNFSFIYEWHSFICLLRMHSYEIKQQDSINFPLETFYLSPTGYNWGKPVGYTGNVFVYGESEALSACRLSNQRDITAILNRTLQRIGCRAVYEKGCANLQSTKFWPLARLLLYLLLFSICCASVGWIALLPLNNKVLGLNPVFSDHSGIS